MSKHKTELLNAPAIIIRNARAHNLKNIDLTLPSFHMIAVTGPSGSGKSSLVFDTLHTEASQRYLRHRQSGAESFVLTSEVDSIEGLSPTVMLKQNLHSSTMALSVARFSQVDDYLRLLFLSIGRLFCTRCGHPIKAYSLNEIASAILVKPAQTRFIVCAPIAAASSEDVKLQLTAWREQGFIRVLLNEDWFTIDEALEAAKKIATVTSLAVVVDRLVIEDNLKSRLLESIRLALQLSQGVVDVYFSDKEVERFTTRLDCTHCGAHYEPLSLPRLKFAPAEELPIIKIGDHPLSELLEAKVDRCLDIIKAFQLTAAETTLAKPLVSQVQTRLACVTSQKLSYIPLSQKLGELSRGELQRLRLAQFLGDSMSGLTYLLDEPSTGLHAEDLKHVVAGVHELCAQGNTVVIVEHDPQLISSAEHVIELGPASGAEGGQIVFEGDAKSHALFRAAQGEPRRVRLPLPASSGAFSIELKTPFFLPFRLELPKARITAVVGLSGTGKTRLLMQELLPALDENTGKPTRKRKSELLSKVVVVDQTPVAQASRSTPVTFMGIMDDLRELFASMPLARARGFKSTQFSLNHRGGRCDNCEGKGYLLIDEEHFGELRMPCSVCAGRRFTSDILEVTYRGFSIADVLELSVHQALPLFAALAKVRIALDVLRQVGLGYLTLGQPVDSLSGGELQRLRLAYALALGAKASKAAKHIFILDEPSAGLGAREMPLLIDIFYDLAAQGHTIIIAEHQLDLIAAADYVIDLSVDAEHAHAQVAFAGSKLGFRQAQTSTARLLNSYLNERQNQAH